MIGRRCALVALGGLLVLVLTVNIYFVRMIIEDSSQKVNTKNPDETKADESQRQTSATDEKPKITKKASSSASYVKIKTQIKNLASIYFKPNSSHVSLVNRLLTELKILPNEEENIWGIPHSNVSSSIESNYEIFNFFFFYSTLFSGPTRTS